MIIVVKMKGYRKLGLKFDESVCALVSNGYY